MIEAGPGVRQLLECGCPLPPLARGSRPAPFVHPHRVSGDSFEIAGIDDSIAIDIQSGFERSAGLNLFREGERIEDVHHAVVIQVLARKMWLMGQVNKSQSEKEGRRGCKPRSEPEEIEGGFPARVQALARFAQNRFIESRRYKQRGGLGGSERAHKLFRSFRFFAFEMSVQIGHFKLLSG